MAWVYDSSLHRYTNGKRVLSERQMLDLRNAIADGMGEESASLATRLLDGEITLAKWAEEFAALIHDGVSAGFVLGRGGVAQMDATAVERLASLIADQLGFAKAFATDLAASLDLGTATVDGVAARSALYGGGAVQAFHVGQSLDWGIELPFYPADGGTECMGNCRCEWHITDTDEQIEATWVTAGDGNVCQGCEARGKEYGPGSPFVQSKAAT
jgi:hypothetical protein